MELPLEPRFCHLPDTGRLYRGRMARHPRRPIADVAIVGQLPPPTHGSAVMTERLASTLAGLGYRVRVVDKRFSTSADDVGRLRFAKLLAVPSLLLRLSRARPRTATVYFLTDRPASFLVDLLGVLLSRGPIIHYLHTSGFEALANRGPLWRLAMHRVLRRAETIVVLGESLVPAISRLAPRTQITVIPNCAPHAIAQKSGALGVRVLFMSNLLPEKGVDTFLAMAKRLAVDHLDVPWEFHIAGSGAVNDADTTDLPLFLHGRYDAVGRARLLANASMLVFPSRYQLEAQPLTIIEAMAAGVPTVAFDIGGIRDLIPAETGRLIALGDLDGLVTTVARLGRDRSALEGASVEARSRYKRNHGSKAFAGSWNRILRVEADERRITDKPQKQPHRVVILQDYVPQYRAPLFRAMINRSSEHGLEIVIASGAVPAGGQRSRNDAARLSTNHVPLPQTERIIFGKRVVLRQSRRVIASADIVVFEQARRNLDLYATLVRRRLCSGTPKIALWGHGGSYVKNESLGERWLRGFLTRSVDWFFAYTPKGSEEATTLGQNPNHLTTLFNTIDTAELRAAIADINGSDIQNFRNQYDLTPRTVIYLGALDSSKGIMDLLALADRCAADDPDFRMLIAGDGADRPAVERAAARGTSIRYIGPVSGRAKALALAASQAIVVTGRVGLVVTDGFAAGRPVLAMANKHHAPEAEYIESEVTGILAPTLDALATRVSALLAEPDRLRSMQAACSERGSDYTIDAYAERYLFGLARLARQPRY